MNWIDKKRKEFEMFTQFDDGSALDWFDNFAQEAHTRGTQEALAKVEGKIQEMIERFGRFIKETNPGAVNTENGYNLACDDLLHNLQQLKDNK